MNFFSRTDGIRLLETINKKSLVKRLIQFIVGCLIISLAYNIFIVPNELVPGGVGGIAVILNHLFGFENSTVIFLMNIGLLIMSFFLLGKEKTKASLLGSILFPIFVRVTEDINIWVQIDTSKVLLSAIFGGLIFGFGAGLVFKAGFTTGGTDILNQIISKYLKTSMGKAMLMSDGLIVLSSAIFFGWNSMLYSIFILYCISLISDRVVLGISDSKAFFIITSKEKEVKQYIIEELGHGVTIFHATGGFKTETERVLFTVLPTREFYRLKAGIKEIDKKAFYIITDTYEVFGGK